MATIYLTLSAKRNRELDVREIMVRFSHGRTNQRSKSGIFIQPDYWDDVHQCVIIPRFRVISKTQRELLDELTGKQRQIDDMKAAIMSAFVSLSEAPTSGWLDGVIHPNRRHNDSSSFFGQWNIFIESRNVSHQRKAMFRVVRDMMERFEKISRISDPAFRLSLDGLTLATLNDFEHFLRNEHLHMARYANVYKDMRAGDLPKPRSQNTISDRMAILRTFIIWAMNNDLTQNDPFKKFEMKAPVYGTPIYISIAERNQLFATPMPTATLTKVRDIFVFQCLIGCRVGDLLRMTKDNIVGNAIEYIPRKTKDGRPITVRVPLNKTARAIIERYADDKRASILPFVSSQKYNQYIKECFRHAGLTRNVTVLDPLTREYAQHQICDVASSHMARRTFVGNLYKQVKDPNLVGALSGHKDGSRAFFRYRDIDEEMKTELVNLLE